jgi:hypothetical protein
VARNQHANYWRRGSVAMMNVTFRSVRVITPWCIEPFRFTSLRGFGGVC